MLMENQIKIAVQKSGRMSEASISLLKACGINFDKSQRGLIAPASNFPASILYLRDDDIPQYVEDGIADIGIVGQNVLEETGLDVATLKHLGFSKCRLSLAVPKSVSYEGLAYFNGKKLATSYPKILEKFLTSKGVNADIHKISGSVEIAPGIGLADGICDIVSTGSTLLANGLKEVDTVLKSEAVLIGHKNNTPVREAIIESLLFRLAAVEKSKNNKYILLNAPNENIEEITSILPGMKSPTVMPLAEEGWSSVHSVIQEDQFWDIINQLQAAGAEGILIIPIEKMIL